MSHNKKLLIIGLVWPEPKSSAAGTRMLQLISFFQEAQYEIHFACAAQESEFQTNLVAMNIHCSTIKLNCSSFDEYVRHLQPDVVLFDRFMIEEQFGWRVEENCPSAIRILDSEDLHCLRSGRQNAFKKNIEFNIDDIFDLEIAVREIASIYRCDLTLIISQFEINLLENVFGINKSLLCYLPFLVGAMNSDDLKSLPTFEGRRDFVFIGNFLHEPNWNAVLYLHETIWPLVRKAMPEAQMKIYGAYPSQKVFQLHNPKQGFYVEGRAENVNDVFKSARVLLAPLRFGAGLKGKLLEAMQNGLPSVTTNIGAEAMHQDLPWNGFVSDNPEEIAAKAQLLYENKVEWELAQQNGIDIINKCYEKKIFEEKFSNRIQDLIDNILLHRKRNFISKMLQHHTMRSTKFMSKWIEEKNKI